MDSTFLLTVTTNFTVNHNPKYLILVWLKKYFLDYISAHFIFNFKHEIQFL